MVLAGVVLGAVFGAWRARQRQGNRLDMAQWGAVYAIVFGLLGLFATIALGRLG
jgi:hypothetical protein